MKQLTLSENTIISTFRYLAHLFSILLIFVVILLAIEKSFPGKTSISLKEILLSFSLLTMLIGLISAWKWEGIGGSLIITGFVSFFLVNSNYSSELNFGFFFFAVPFYRTIILVLLLERKKERINVGLVID